MSIESALYDKLTGTAALTALIGSGNDCRLYPELAPASTTKPYVTFSTISTTRSRHFAGITNSQVDFARVQVDIWAATSVSRRDTAEAVRDAMDGFSGAMGDEALDVRRVEVVGPQMQMDAPFGDDEVPTYRAILELEISHR